MTYNVSQSVKNRRYFLSNIIYISDSIARKVVYFIMQRMTGIPRNQVFSSLEDTILPENSVRFIDAFVKHYR
jgi:hypothetical protein